MLGVELIDLAQDGNRSRTLMKVVINFGAP